MDKIEINSKIEQFGTVIVRNNNMYNNKNNKNEYKNEGGTEQDDRVGEPIGIRRLNTYEESGRLIGGARNVAATNILRGSEAASPYEQRRIVTEWAITVGMMSRKQLKI